MLTHPAPGTILRLVRTEGPTLFSRETSDFEAVIFGRLMPAEHLVLIEATYGTYKVFSATFGPVFVAPDAVTPVS